MEADIQYEPERDAAGVARREVLESLTRVIGAPLDSLSALSEAA